MIRSRRENDSGRSGVRRGRRAPTVGSMFRTLAPRQLAFDVATPAVLAVLALLYIGSGRFFGIDIAVQSAIIIGMAAAAALRRLSPGLALGVAWLVAIGQ